MLELRCILADDEPLALSLLESLMSGQRGIAVVGTYHDGMEALAGIREHKPDLAVLDIEMPGLSGFDVVRRLQPEDMPAIIFATAFDQYAIEAFDIHAVDYVLKPLEDDRLRLAVERARNRLAGEQQLRVGEKASIMSAIGQLAGDGEQQPLEDPETSESGRLLISDSGKTHVVDPAEIDWVDAAGDYMCIHVGPETLVARMTMKKLEQRLDENTFARIHRSTLVNVTRVRRFENLGKGDCVLHLEGGEKLKASRNYRNQLMAMLA